jgi:hypothetical protein
MHFKPLFSSWPGRPVRSTGKKTFIVGTAAACLLAVTAFSGGLGFGPGEATGQQRSALVLPDTNTDSNSQPLESVALDRVALERVAFVEVAADVVRKPRRSPKMVGQSGVVEKIQRELDSETTMEFIETPLSDVVRYLNDLHGISIQLDQRAMDQAGLTGDLPITLNLKNVSFRSSLRLLLQRSGRIRSTKIVDEL